METCQHPAQWYTRRGGVVRGPFSMDEVTRHIILGRICMDDELSQDRMIWTAASCCTNLLPAELRNLSSWDDYQQLVVARMQVDERKGERRCKQCSNHSCCHPERRSAVERRGQDSDRLVRQYLFGRPRASGMPAPRHSKLHPLLLTLLITGLVLVWLLPIRH